ncbi:hypothetical protein DRQ20_03530, partial [bacterium]
MGGLMRIYMCYMGMEKTGQIIKIRAIRLNTTISNKSPMIPPIITMLLTSLMPLPVGTLMQG